MRLDGEVREARDLREHTSMKRLWLGWGVAALLVAGMVPLAAEAQEKPKKVTDFLTVEMHYRWKCSKGYAAGEFIYFFETDKDAGGFSAPVLFISSKAGKKVSDKHTKIATPDDQRDFIVGSYAYDKKKKSWTFTVKGSGMTYGKKAIPDNDERAAAIAKALASWFTEIPIGKENGKQWLRTDEFLKFCEKEFNQENPLFLRRARTLRESFHAGAKEKVLKGLWEEIVQEHLTKDAKFQINIDAQQSGDLLALANNGSLKVGTALKSGGALDKALEEAETEIYTLATTDSFTRFKPTIKDSTFKSRDAYAEKYIAVELQD
jgi:hypothetical protein